jgi:hypothetical protein
LIDFDRSVLNGEGEAGLSLNGLVSVDRLLNASVTPADDFEAACLAAEAWRGAPSCKAESQRKLLQHSVGLMCEVLEETKTEWYHNILFYLWTKPLTSPVDMGVLRLEKQPLRQKEWSQGFYREQKERIAIKTGPKRKIHADLGGYVEAWLLSEKELLSTGDWSEFKHNQVVESRKQKGVTFTEFDAICTNVTAATFRSSARTQNTPQCPGGDHLVVEVWTSDKSEENLLHKFQVLPDDHRPIHVLHFFHSFFLVGAGIKVTSATGVPAVVSLRMSQSDLLEVFLSDEKFRGLAVLCAAGRLKRFHIETLSVIELARASQLTLSTEPQIRVNPC